ncbi:3-isopropylmalate dehydrogenase [Helicovermis profundi]|uniref:3-isopropylmalate dehydrogenase n=1 Tax=Helicovermis profundi TaxID=3065157 RepID=A0AAU9E3Y4_9FIRM|nr:3-isopropylmalate dehydrogenase [Clostridia bacterium S502]
MKYNIAVLRGDGIGSEIVEEAIKVLFAIKGMKEKIDLKEYSFGGCAYDKFSHAFPSETKEGVMKADAVLLGAVGGPKWNELPLEKRPESALLSLRKTMEVFCNIRPVKIFDSLKNLSPIKLENRNIDYVIVRELISGIYFGNKNTETIGGEIAAKDEMFYSESQIKRAIDKAIEIASKRNNKITLVDKANVLETSRLWRKVAKEKVRDSKTEIDYMYVDNAAMQVILNPDKFDVIVTSNMFGDIISDESGAIVGSIGLLPSASISESGLGLYEPIHGSAPDIAGKNIANPIGTILSVALLLRYSLKMDIEAEIIEKAVENAINNKILSKDIIGESGFSTCEIGEYIANEVKNLSN